LVAGVGQLGKVSEKGGMVHTSPSNSGKAFAIVCLRVTSSALVKGLSTKSDLCHRTESLT
jgi:hypothetical protein